jgi:hypothetical protein
VKAELDLGPLASPHGEQQRDPIGLETPCRKQDRLGGLWIEPVGIVHQA